MVRSEVVESSRVLGELQRPSMTQIEEGQGWELRKMSAPNKLNLTGVVAGAQTKNQVAKKGLRWGVACTRV